MSGAERPEVRKRKVSAGPGAPSEVRKSDLQQRINYTTERWEQDRMASGTLFRKRKNETSSGSSGGSSSGGASNLFHKQEEADDFKVETKSILVMTLLPPFLERKFSFKEGVHMTLPVKDPTSDIVTLARKGSSLISEERAKRERLKGQRKDWELAGTRIGEILGVHPSEGNAGDDPEDEMRQEALQIRDFVEAQSKTLLSDSQDTRNLQTTHINNAQTAKPDFRRILEAQESRSKLASSSDEKDEIGSSQNVTTLDPRLQILATRKSLPVFSQRRELLQVIRDNKVVIVVGETGSGKTTQLTQYLYEDGYTRQGSGIIACTQPRRVAAISVAKRVAEEMDTKLGRKVGYSIRFEDCTSKETLIKYMTDGLLLRESLTDPDLSHYSVIIMDEAHERSLNTDVLFGVLRKLIRNRRDIKVIITSATMDAKKFSDFFGQVPIFEIKGRTFPVDVLYSSSVVEDYVESAIQKALSIHLQQPPGDILVFMTGQEDIDCTARILTERIEALVASQEEDNRQHVSPVIILPIYSQLPAELQAKIFQKTSDKARKIIIATNIAETSLTLHGILYVIDSGFAKYKVYNPKIGMDSLLVYPISQANANQRSGRAGRTAPGICYRLYTENQYISELLPASVPEIQRSNLTNTVLQLKSMGIKDILQFDFMDPPSEQNLLSSLYQLWLLDALDHYGELTDLGKKMVHFPIDPSLSKMLIQAGQLGCVDEIITIIALLSVPMIFYRPRGREEESDQKRDKFTVPESDHLTLLNVYKQWEAHKCSSSWCKTYFLQHKNLLKVKEVREQLVDIARGAGMQLSTANQEWDCIRECICTAFFQNGAKIKGLTEYTNLRSGVSCHMHRTSSLYDSGFNPEYVIYHEIVFTSREYMQIVTTVEPEWLAKYGCKLFKLKLPSTSLFTQNSVEVELYALKEQKKTEKYAKIVDEQKSKARAASLHDSHNYAFLESATSQRISRNLSKGRRFGF